MRVIQNNYLTVMLFIYLFFPIHRMICPLFAFQANTKFLRERNRFRSERKVSQWKTRRNFGRNFDVGTQYSARERNTFANKSKSIEI